MHYISDLSESSLTSHLVSTDTASNWSKPVKKQKGKCKEPAVPRRITRSALAKNIRDQTRLQDNYLVTKAPRLKLRRCCLKIRKPANVSVKQTRAMIEQINDESRVVYYFWPICQQQTIELEAEVARLQQRLHELQVEEVEIKRKRWCRVCEDEATYVYCKRFYCSKECEQKYGIPKQL